MSLSRAAVPQHNTKLLALALQPLHQHAIPVAPNEGDIQSMEANTSKRRKHNKITPHPMGCNDYER